jgi:hypothetical protein
VIDVAIEVRLIAIAVKFAIDLISTIQGETQGSVSRGRTRGDRFEDTVESQSHHNPATALCKDAQMWRRRLLRAGFGEVHVTKRLWKEDVPCCMR